MFLYHLKHSTDLKRVSKLVCFVSIPLDRWWRLKLSRESFPYIKTTFDVQHQIRSYQQIGLRVRAASVDVYKTRFIGVESTWREAWVALASSIHSKRSSDHKSIVLSTELMMRKLAGGGGLRVLLNWPIGRWSFPFRSDEGITLGNVNLRKSLCGPIFTLTAQLIN